jgi:TPR repeat protein
MKVSWLVVGLCGLLAVGPATAGADILTNKEVMQYRKAAEQGDAQAQYQLGFHYYLLRDKQAVKWYRRAADKGHAEAQNQLGVMYEGGWLVPKDDQEAMKWYRKAADKGHSFAQVRLGRMYAEGRGVPQDHQEAANWYRKAGEQGDYSAEVMLGEIYERGQGVLKDYREAEKWYIKAAQKNLKYLSGNRARYRLGVMYAEGRGVERDYQEAIRWFSQATGPFSSKPQAALGWMYAHGKGVRQDLRTAAELYHQAAMGSLTTDINDQDREGELLREAEGAKWYQRAADLGFAEAQFRLGMMYAKGQPVPQNYVQAHVWFILAAAQGHEEARNARDRLSKAMVPAQIAEAQRLARAWQLEVAAMDPPPWAEEQPSASGDSTEVQATGSGFVISRAGHVLTNHHVVAGCAQVRIPPNGTAQVVAADPNNDLALLNTGQGTTAIASFREGGGARLGESVVAVGFPLRGLLATGPNVTTGIVSALAGPGNDTRLLQTSAPVQPGNSGGPLLDASGRVIGVVVGKLDAIKVVQATGDIPQNVNFAITAASARSFLDAQSFAYSTAASTQILDTADIAEAAKRFTVVVECWK